MARRKNILDQGELAILEKKTKSYVELFVKDCELRNLRPHTIQYYMNEFKAFLNSLTAKGINIAESKPYNMRELYIKEINFYFIDGYLIIKLKG
ncbi:hypothetical protein LAV33_04205 [Bacillus safensis]|uniref:hypothetical protein n=1 Tax=Bacillus safensis TaxID=561879 RepID=UPI002B247453|nr:hypothetical protein [Bacillus safensis]MEB2269473.1 hypothetical protein [Bacillus safensis]